MRIVALTHGYPPLWNMGGEVALHRSLLALVDAGHEVTVLTRTSSPYVWEGVVVEDIDTPDVLDVRADPTPIAKQLKEVGADVVIAQNELSLPGVLAARSARIPSIVGVHTPPRYGAAIREGVKQADACVFNTRAAAGEWRARGIVLHPLIDFSGLPEAWRAPEGRAYTVLSSLVNKGVTVVLELAKRLPEQPFIIVRSPAEPTHGLEDLEERAASLPNVELAPRVHPRVVAERYLSRTRILLVPSRYETYGMSAIEAAARGIPSVHVDTPHVREGIGTSAWLVPPLDVEATRASIDAIEANYEAASRLAFTRAQTLATRQEEELEGWVSFVERLRRRTTEAPTIARGYTRPLGS